MPSLAVGYRIAHGTAVAPGHRARRVREQPVVETAALGAVHPASSATGTPEDRNLEAGRLIAAHDDLARAAIVLARIDRTERDRRQLDAAQRVRLIGTREQDRRDEEPAARVIDT